jgi:hypothetical protein
LVLVVLVVLVAAADTLDGGVAIAGRLTFPP